MATIRLTVQKWGQDQGLAQERGQVVTNTNLNLGRSWHSAWEHVRTRFARRWRSAPVDGTGARSEVWFGDSGEHVQPSNGDGVMDKKEGAEWRLVQVVEKMEEEVDVLKARRYEPDYIKHREADQLAMEFMLVRCGDRHGWLCAGEFLRRVGVLHLRNRALGRSLTWVDDFMTLDPMNFPAYFAGKYSSELVLRHLGLGNPLDWSSRLWQGVKLKCTESRPHMPTPFSNYL